MRSLLKRGELEAARERVALLVSRDMSREGESGIIRATLDSMIGYRNEKYRDFGWDDIL